MKLSSTTGASFGGVNEAATQNSIIYRGKGIGNFTSSNKIDSATNQLVDFKPGRTLWVVFQSMGVGVITTENILGCNTNSFAGGKGWWLTRQAITGTMFLLAANGGVAVLGTPNNYGITIMCLKWNNTTNSIDYSFNGGPVLSSGSIALTAPVDSTCKSYIGTDNGILGGIALASGRVVGYTLWDHEASLAESKNYTFSNKNRLKLSTNVTQDAGAIINFDASLDWDGLSPTITTRGLAPLTYNVINSPTLYNLDEIRFSLLNYNFHDTKVKKDIVDSLYKYTIRDSFSNIRMTSDSYYIGIETYSTLYTLFQIQSSYGLFKNGSISDEQRATQVDTPTMIDLYAGTETNKSILISEGARSAIADEPKVLGNFIQAIRVPIYLLDGVTKNNLKFTNPTRNQNRLVLVGDSILTGFSSANIVQNSPATLLRSDYPGGITSFTAGFQSIFDIASTSDLANDTANLISQELDGELTNKIWLNLGTNDYGFVYGESASAFQTNYSRLVDAINLLSPNAIIYCQTPTQRISPSSESANGSGNTLDDYRTAISNVVSTRTSFCTLVIGTSIISNSNIDSDGLHPTNAGYAQYKAFIKATLGY